MKLLWLKEIIGDAYTEDMDAAACQAIGKDFVICRGGSCIVDPYGHYVEGPVWDREEMILTDLNMEQVARSRMEFDPCGHYARPDVLTLKVIEA